MDTKWDSYTHFPASGEEFERYVATVFDDLGYKVYLTPEKNDYGVDLLLEEPKSQTRIAVQTKFYNRATLGNAPIQEVLAGLSLYKAQVGWVVTNGRFSENATKLAKANGVRLIDNDGLNELIDQAKERRELEKARIEEAAKAEIEAIAQSQASLREGTAEEGARPSKAASEDETDEAPSASPASDDASKAADASPGEAPSASRMHPTSAGVPIIAGAASPSLSGIIGPAPASVPSIPPSPSVPRSAPQQPASQPSAPLRQSALSPSNPATPYDPSAYMSEPVGAFQYVSVYNPTDIQARWGTDLGYVYQQIDEGMPMVRLPNGDWGITQDDLMAWEGHMEEQRRRQLRGQQGLSIVLIAVAIVIFVVCIFLLAGSGFFD